MEIALIALVAILVVCVAILATRKKTEDVEALKSKVDDIALALKGVETKVVESTGSIKEFTLRDFGGLRELLTKMMGELKAREKFERESEDSLRRIEAIVVGSKSRGKAGENILEEALKKFPPQIIERNFKINGHPVEYAMVLADGKRVPIDSKWTAPELIESLDLEANPARREEIIKQIEQSLLSKVKEVTKYVDPPVTVRWGVAAVPDSVFAVCRHVHLDAFRDRVIVMPYSLTIIYLLSLYQLHLHYYSPVDIERLKDYLDQMERGLEQLDRELENKVSRGTTMITNAFNECKRVIGEMRGAAAYLKALPTGGAQLELSEKSEAENNVDREGV
ncbi:DNA recombination protein RmuC [Dehalococcoidales bacterium]|nr:DNA recombination protein RmuC [Dehalococcoidales bacterium]